MKTAKRGKRKQNAKALFYMILFATIVCLVALAAILLTNQNENIPVVEPVVSETSSEPEVSSEPPAVKEPATVRMMGVGDNLIHEGIYNQAKKRAGGTGYDFNYAYENIEKIIQLADIASINQETVMADIYEPSSYPMFNSPTTLGRHLVDKVGFDVFNLANNHTIDKGEKGLLSTLDFWRTQPVLTTGAYQNQEDYDKIRTTTVNDITFSFIGMTELTNGLNLPKGSDVVLMRLGDQDKIKERIEKAKAISDVVVVNVHWGVEYTHTPNTTQTAMAQKMVEWGADIILGHHPHVIQPVEYIERSDGTRGIVAYSLGNFISAQEFGPRMVGGLLDLTITKDYEQNTVSISSARFVPIVTHYDSGFANIRNYVLDDYTAELAQKHGCRKATPAFDLAYINNMVSEVIDPQFLTSYLSE